MHVSIHCICTDTNTWQKTLRLMYTTLYTLRSTHSSIQHPVYATECHMFPFLLASHIQSCINFLFHSSQAAAQNKMKMPTLIWEMFHPLLILSILPIKSLLEW